MSRPPATAPILAPSTAGDRPAILLTGAGKRYDIVACFAAADHDGRRRPQPARAGAVRRARARCGAADRGPGVRAGARAPVRRARGRRGAAADRPRHRGHSPLARADGRLPALVPSPEVARATYDKYEAHLLLARARACPRRRPSCRRPTSTRCDYPVMVKPRRGSGRARSTSRTIPRRRGSSSTTSPSRRWSSGRWAAPSCRSTVSATATGAA